MGFSRYYYLFLFLLPSAFLLQLQCTPSLTHANHDSHSKSNDKLECYDAVEDSLKTVFSHDARRSKQVIAVKINGYLKEIEDFLSTQGSVFKNTDSAKCLISIFPNGKANAIIIKSDLNYDSLSSKQIQKLINKIEFDSIPMYPFSIRTTLLAKKVKSNNVNVSFTDSIKYLEIRSQASIMKTTMINLRSLKDAYQQRLSEKRGLKGKITVKYALDEYGKVIFSKVIESTIADKILEKTVEDKILTWKYCPIDNPGDVIEVIYPFVFSQ